MTTQASAKESRTIRDQERRPERQKSHSRQMPAAQQTQGGEEKQGVGPEPPQAVPDLSVGVAECFRHAAFSLRLGWIGHPPALEELCGRDP